MTASEKIELVLDWAQDQEVFDTSFVESLAAALDKWGSLTDRQEAALDNIIEKFHI